MIPVVPSPSLPLRAWVLRRVPSGTTPGEVHPQWWALERYPRDQASPDVTLHLGPAPHQLLDLLARYLNELERQRTLLLGTGEALADALERLHDGRGVPVDEHGRLMHLVHEFQHYCEGVREGYTDAPFPHD